MPAHKNQHFVPRCALKPFSLEGVGDAINVFNIKAKRAIPNAPTRGQCARDYLYGKGDLRTEHLLMKLEGHYARIVSLLSTESALSTTDTEWLRVSILVQMRRTELAIEQMRNFTKSMADTAFARAPHHRPSDDRTDTQVMHQSILSALNLLHYASDLKVIIFRNRTNVDFVTCDNPAIQTNRLHFQKLKQHHFGVSSSGTILSMPISPRLSAICYDTGVYLVPNGSGTQFVDLTSRSDVYAINQLQYLAAAKNLYFSRWEEADRIQSEFLAVAESRVSASARSTMYIRDDDAADASVLRNPETGRIEKYRRGTPEEEKTANETIVATSFIHPEPANWPSKLKFRPKLKTFYNGSAIGYVRKLEWLTRS